MKKQEIERVGDNIAARFPGVNGSNDFKDYLVDTAFKSGLNIVVFTMTYELKNVEAIEDFSSYKITFRADYLSSQFNIGEFPGSGIIDIYNPNIIEDFKTFFTYTLGNERFSYITGARRGNYLVYGSNLNNSYYMYISSPLVPIDSTTSVLTNQLLIVTVICLLLSVILSWYISSRISKPISEFSRTAQKLAKGDYEVRFVGNGYTEIEHLAETLNYATEEMAKTEALRRDFLANVSHDLRTPLTMVKAYAEMIRDISGKDEKKRRDHSQVIIDEADRLTTLVNDILNLSKLQAGTESIECEKVDLGVLAKVVIERFDIFSTRDGYCFTADIDPDCVIYGDSKRLEQVLYNLIGNALNYAGENKHVYVFVKKQEHKVNVAVCDTGKGIAPDEIDAVWERYYRASQRKRGVVGSGLGLSIVKNILIAHKAEYGIKSELNRGTAFWFAMPVIEQQAELMAQVDEHAENTRKRKGKPPQNSEKEEE